MAKQTKKNDCNLSYEMDYNLTKFQIAMDERLLEGKKRYGDDWKEKDLWKDMEEELLDLANYAFLKYHKIQMLKKEEEVKP